MARQATSLLAGNAADIHRDFPLACPLPGLSPSAHAAASGSSPRRPIEAAMPSKRLLRLRHQRTDVGFFSASVAVDGDRDSHWSLRVEAPSSAEEFRDHLTAGSSMSLSMVTRDGVQLRGEAYVSSLSDGVDSATVVLLAGSGPLKRV
jgi:hypothetical protein